MPLFFSMSSISLRMAISLSSRSRKTRSLRSGPRRSPLGGKRHIRRLASASSDHAQALWRNQQFLARWARKGPRWRSTSKRADEGRMIGADNGAFGEALGVGKGMRQVIEIGKCRRPRRPHHQVEGALTGRLVRQASPSATGSAGGASPACRQADTSALENRRRFHESRGDAMRLPHARSGSLDDFQRRRANRASWLPSAFAVPGKKLPAVRRKPQCDAAQEPCSKFNALNKNGPP